MVFISSTLKEIKTKADEEENKQDSKSSDIFSNQLLAMLTGS